MPTETEPLGSANQVKVPAPAIAESVAEFPAQTEAPVPRGAAGRAVIFTVTGVAVLKQPAALDATT